MDNKRERSNFACMLILYSGGYSLLGMLYVHITEDIPFSLIEMALVAIFSMIFVYDFSIRWHNFIYRKKSHSLTYLIVAGFIYCVLMSLIMFFHKSPNSKKVILCVIEVLVYYIVASTFLKFTVSGEVKSTSRRIVLMAPLFFGMLQPAMFGCAIVLANGSQWEYPFLAILLIGVYLVIWRTTITLKRGKVLFYNGVLAIVVLGFIVSYYINLPQAGNSGIYKISYSIVIKSQTLSFLCPCIMGIPGLLEIVQHIRRDDNKEMTEEELIINHSEYADNMKIISVLDAFAVMIVHLSWLWLPFSWAYIAYYAIGSLIVVLWTRNNYEKRKRNPYRGSWVASIALPVIPIGFMCYILFCVKPSYDLPIEIPAITAYVCGGMGLFFEGIAFIWRILPKLSLNMILERVIKIRLIGIRTVGLSVTLIISGFFSAIEVVPSRSRFLMVVILIELVLQGIGLFIILYGEKMFSENEKPTLP